MIYLTRITVFVRVVLECVHCLLARLKHAYDLNSIIGSYIILTKVLWMFIVIASFFHASLCSKTICDEDITPVPSYLFMP